MLWYSPNTFLSLVSLYSFSGWIAKFDSIYIALCFSMKQILGATTFVSKHIGEAYGWYFCFGYYSRLNSGFFLVMNVMNFKTISFIQGKNHFHLTPVQMTNEPSFKFLTWQSLVRYMKPSSFLGYHSYTAWKRCMGECNVIFCVKGKRQSILENLSSNDINKWLNRSKKCRTALQLTIVQVSLEKFKKWGEIFIYIVLFGQRNYLLSAI